MQMDKYKDWRIDDIKHAVDYQSGGELSLMLIDFKSCLEILRADCEHFTLEMLEKQLKDLMKMVNNIEKRLDYEKF